MIIDLNILKRLGKRFGVFPISVAPKALQAALQKPESIFIKAPAGIEPSFTGGGYQWDDELNGYRFGNQKLFLVPDGTTIWTFKDVLFRGLNLDSVQKWTSADAEYPMGKANAFFIVYGKLTGQNLGEGETAGNEVADGATDPGEGGGLATADDETAPPYSKDDIQKMLKGEFPVDAPSAGSKASMDTAIPDEPSPTVSGPPPDRSKVGQPLPPEMGSEAEKIIKTLYKRAKINPNTKLSKQNPIRLDGDEIIDLWQRAKAMSPEEGEKLIAFLKSGAVLPLEEGKIANYQLQNLMEAIVSGIVGEVEKAKQKAKNKRKVSKPASKGFDAKDTLSKWRQEDPHGPGEPPEHSQMDWDKGADLAPSYGATGPSEEGAYKEWLEDLANKMWKDPNEIGHGQFLWRVDKARRAGTGEMVYLLKKRKTVEQSRFFMKKDNQWFYLDPKLGNHKWTSLNVNPPGEEPSIEQEGKQKKSWTVPFKGRNELDEMTTTSGGGGSSAGTPGYNIPGAFGKKMANRKGHIEVLGYKMTALGEKEYNTPADKLYESIKKNIHRMMREGLTQEGKRTCPHCNMMAVNGIWTHEQGCPASKKRVKEASGLGANFDKAQTRYDAQMPQETPPEIECPQCGKMGYIKTKGSKGSSWWWKAECPNCKHKWEDDNF